MYVKINITFDTKERDNKKFIRKLDEEMFTFGSTYDADISENANKLSTSLCIHFVGRRQYRLVKVE